jgi:hypothetical protein
MTAPDAYLEEPTKGGVPGVALLAAQSPEARGAMREAICAHSRNDAIELAMPAVIASSEKL